MRHQVTEGDKAFIAGVESCEFPVDDFDHRAHLRLAYVYLVRSEGVEAAVDLTRMALHGLLESAGIEPATKYHETLTEAWILAVHHFMNNTEAAESADDFIDQHPEMLDPKLMYTHYSADVLFSDQARKGFVEPDLDPIPRQGG